MRTKPVSIRDCGGVSEERVFGRDDVFAPVSIRDCGGVSEERCRLPGCSPSGVSIRDCGGVSEERAEAVAEPHIRSQSATVAG